jgi:acid phosphatase (class A)
MRRKEDTVKTTANSSTYTALLFLIAILAGCATSRTEPAQTDDAVMPEEQIEEIAPGFLQGYLTPEDQLDSKEFVLPAPAEDSAQLDLDTAWSEAMLKLQGTARWDAAIRDAELTFPAAAESFSCALGMTIDEQDTPALYMLMRRTLTDLGLATYSAKNAYQRERPFMVLGTPICTPEDKEALRKDGSYPSGHTALGWGWALILTELSPDRAEQLLARGRAFGESRNVCNVHWYSDVVAGRLVGSAAVARLHANESFQAAMKAARADITRVRAAGLGSTSDCEAESDALASPL